MAEDTKCIFCQSQLPKPKESLGPLAQQVRYNCSKCGFVFITDECEWQFDQKFLKENGYLISGALRWRTVRGLRNKQALTVQDVENLLESSEVPKSVIDKADRLVLYVGEQSKTFGQLISCNTSLDYPITFSPTQEEFERIFHYLQRQSILDPSAPGQCLTMDGWARFYEIHRVGTDVKQCFVAMNFDNEYDPIYRDIAVAIEACGFVPYCVKTIQHNNVITDLIVSEIKKSRFLVADVSGGRPSVYFEAGFAKGLGKEVIWMCKEGEKLHFDTRQYNHIIWRDGADLKEQLIRRIEVSIK